MRVLPATLLLSLLALCVGSTRPQPLAARETPQGHGRSVVARRCAPLARKPTVAEARQAIETAINKAVPPGVSRSRVEAWLRSQKMEIQRVTGSTLGRTDYLKLLKDHGYSPSDLSGMIVSFRLQSLRGSEFVAAFTGPPKAGHA
jgi:hypothetical protein